MKKRILRLWRRRRRRLKVNRIKRRIIK